ncbi:MAG: hypothetical protein GC160_22860 [Acidobacteria bacterium]|nr:hypothetical protein [Acidobacteriota bacterium]
MISPIRRTGRPSCILAAIAAFLCLGMALLPVLGIQNDEAVSVGAFHPPESAVGVVATPLGEAPLMQVSYAGTLKSWLYRHVFQAFAPSKLSIRLPVLLLGAWTLWLFHGWARRVGSERMAAFAALLLACDPSFVITTCFDWGPTVLQHLLLIAGLWAWARYAGGGGKLWLAGGCAAFGLGLWDKALFVWMLTGVVGATVLVYRTEALRMLSVRRVGLGMASFCLAASPFLVYNLSTQGATAGAFEPQLGPEHLRYRLALLHDTLDGSALLDSMVEPPPGESAQPSPKPFDWPTTPLPLLFVIALAATPWRGDEPEQRLRRWAAVAFLIAYPQTLIGKDVGVGSHHVVLLWPLPHLIVAGFLASLWTRGRAWRRPAGVALAVCLAANAAMLALFVGRGYTHGAAVIWTNAITGLRDELRALEPEQIWVLDWGAYDALRVLGEGRLPIHGGMEPFSSPESPDPAALDQAAPWVAAPGSVFVDHAAGRRIFPRVRPRFDGYIHSLGLRPVTLALVRDRLGRPTFEVFRLEAQKARAVGPVRR